MANTSGQRPDPYSGLKTEVGASIRSHAGKEKLDSLLYNGGVVVALACTAAAAALSWDGDWGWVPRALSGLAAFLIGVERALNFGSRMQFHTAMKHRYSKLLRKLELAQDDSQSEELLALHGSIVDLEDRIPGMAGAVTVRASEDA